MTVCTMEEALYKLYSGQTNVAIAAKEQKISADEMKRLFRVFVSKMPIDPDIWQRDVEPSWPYIT
jgi:hypothetical protein